MLYSCSSAMWCSMLWYCWGQLGESCRLGGLSCTTGWEGRGVLEPSVSSLFLFFFSSLPWGGMLLKGGEKKPTQSAFWLWVSFHFSLQVHAGEPAWPCICGGIIRASGVGCSWSRCLNTGLDLDFIYKLGIVLHVLPRVYGRRVTYLGKHLAFLLGLWWGQKDQNCINHKGLISPHNIQGDGWEMKIIH